MIHAGGILFEVWADRLVAGMSFHLDRLPAIQSEMRGPQEQESRTVSTKACAARIGAAP